jgi:hypothetical protein
LPKIAGAAGTPNAPPQLTADPRARQLGFDPTALFAGQLHAAVPAKAAPLANAAPIANAAPVAAQPVAAKPVVANPVEQPPPAKAQPIVPTGPKGFNGVIKKGKQWHEGMVDARGKAVPKPPRQTSNAHFDKNGNFQKWTSPLVFDLNGNNKVGTTGVENGRTFDIDGNGKAEKTSWAEKGDGVLAFDRDGNGKVGENGKELFGNATDLGDGKRYANGFEALKGLAQTILGDNAVNDGVLDQNELKALEQKAGVSMLVDGQRRSLSDLGISAVNLGYTEAGANTDANGDQHRQIGAGFVRNGERKQVDDVWFRHT